MEPVKIPGLVWLPVFTVVGLVIWVSAVTPYDQEQVVLMVGVAGINTVLSPLVGLAASKKGRSFWAFFWVSFFVGILIPAIIVATMNQPEATAQGALKICPQCAENVKDAAVVCRYCRHNF